MRLSKVLGKTFLPLLLIFTVPLLSVAHAVTIEEYHTPTPDSSPTDLQFDSQGNLWFTMINASKLGKMVPAQAKAGKSDGITEYSVPTPKSSLII